jgi:hypothetical protein
MQSQKYGKAYVPPCTFLAGFCAIAFVMFVIMAIVGFVYALSVMK